MNTMSKHEEYLEKAKSLSRIEAEQLFSRMRGKLARRMGDKKLDPVEAIARQLAFEDEQLNEWRTKVAEIRTKSKH